MLSDLPALTFRGGSEWPYATERVAPLRGKGTLPFILASQHFH